MVPAVERLLETEDGLTLMLASGSQRMMKFAVGSEAVGMREVTGGSVYGMGHWPLFEPRYPQ
jgi:hypothetical protein